MRSNCWHGSRSYTRNRSIKYRFTRGGRGHQKPPKHGVQIGDESTETGDRRISLVRSLPSDHDPHTGVRRTRERPFWATVAVAALYLPASIAARALVDPVYAAGRRGVPRRSPTRRHPLPATLVAGALWLLVAGGFLYAFAAELDAMRTRTASRAPAKGYLILAAGSLLAHPVTGTPFCSCSSPDTRFIADCESVSGAGSAPTARTFIPTRFVM